MSIEIKVPQLPESVEDATVGTWHKKPGEAVSRDENLVDLETDKVVLEVPAPEDGVLGEIRVQEGEVVGAGDVLGLVEEGRAAETSGAAAEAAESAPETTGQPTAETAAETTEPAGETTAAAAPASAPGPMSPAVRRLVEDHDLDPSRIRGTGKGGRLTKADVLEYMEKAEEAGKAEAPAAGETPAAGTPESPAPESGAPAARAPEAPAKDEDSRAAAAPPAGAAAEGRSEQRVPMTRMRARIAERLVEAQQTAAMLTTFNEVDLKAVKELRQRYRESFEREHGVRLGYMSFFVKACVEALKRFPVVNASIDGQDIIYHGYFDIGIAVASPRGLVVPILRDADQMSYAEIEKTISEFGDKAEGGKLTLEELTGGTFSITNGGVFGSLVSTPILNPPQTAILGMHKIEDRPVVRDGEIVVRPMMYLALSYDHRLVDGKEAVQFLVAVKEMLEDPARLLLQV